MYSDIPSGHQVQSIRPNLADLTNDHLFEKLQAEADQLRNGQTVTIAGSDPAPVFSSTRSRAEVPKATTAKKSRFALQREAQLHSSKSIDDTKPVPTGRFELDLGMEDIDGQNPPPASNADSQAPTPLVAEIVERCSMNAPSNHFDPTFRADAMPVSRPPTSTNSKSTIPPWELRRIASLQSSQKSQQTPIDKPYIPVARAPHRCDPRPSMSLTAGAFTDPEKRQISDENQALLSQMGSDEILREQAAIKDHLMQSNPQLLAKLLDKFNVKMPTNPVLSDEPTPPSPISKTQKHVRYAEDEKISLNPPKLSSEIRSCVPGKHFKVNHHSLNDPIEPRPMRFDWNGVHVADTQDSHRSVDHSFDENIHVHHTSTYTLKQLLRLILSAVPSQRIMGFKILTQIVVRYFGNSPTHGLDERELVILTEELNGANLEILTITSQATRERNVGIATSALTLMGSILSKASLGRISSSRYKCGVQRDWIEELITQTTLLADFHSQLEHQELPRPSLTLIVEILRDLIILGESPKVSEEIVKRPTFLELIVQVLVAVPWPLNTQPKLELPDLSAFELFLELARSSRVCSQSILDRGLLTPMLRFIALPYWSLPATWSTIAEGRIQVPRDHVVGVLIRCMCYQFELISVFAGYGLGANLRTTLDPLLRTTTTGLHQILKDAVSGSSSHSAPRAAQEFTLISTFLKLLSSWIQCADDPHFCDPPHSITWSQVTEWESSFLDFLRLSSISSSRSPGLDRVFVCACDSLASYIGRSHSKKLNITGCLAQLDSLMPQLESIFQIAAKDLIGSSYEHFTSQSDCTHFQLLISIAKLKASISKSNSLATSYFQHDFPDHTFALTCRLGFEFESLSLLPWSLSVFDHSGDTTLDLERILLAGLLARNSEGMIVGELLGESLRRSQCRANIDWQEATKSSTQAMDLSRLLPIFNDYLDQSAPSTQISDPSPRQLQNQISQKDPSAFLLTPTWPLLAIAFLKPGHLTSAAAGTYQIRSSDVVRASFTLAIVLQSLLCTMQARFESLSNIFEALLPDRISIWKSVMTAILATSSQTYSLEHEDSGKPLESIFEDENCARLINRLIDISPRRILDSRILETKLGPSGSEAFKVQESEDGELYTMFTEILAAFDSACFGNQSFIRILVPFLSMRRGREFRGKLFSDHGDILKNMKVRLEEVIELDESGCDDHVEGDCDELQEYLYPLENHTQMLHLFAEFLTTHSRTINAREHPFLFLYLIHHLSSQIWNPELDERIRMDLLKVMLNKAKSDEICRAFLDYPAGASFGEPRLSASQVRSTLSAGKLDVEKARYSKEARLASLQALFFSSLPGDHHSSLMRLKELGWEISPSPPLQ
ncbi:hypothetical protein VP01_1g5 [Puccinia sorghi]|uniref:Uncharacterized protein n=1 Tax=Puccinia sorghi TaxID=27349 RepID=A0A0L6VBE9_9BASI|nr:hypothetical protein VP01_1g5 [Puccinia sorghi]